jgi:succinylglutamate desuccinylase
MTSFFFSPHRNFIRHTIANADESVAARHEILPDGTEVTLLDCGVIKFEPNTACDTSLIVSCGVHGNETAPIEIASAIIDDLLSEQQPCRQRVLFIFGNPWAMAVGERFIELNMNRLFNGDWQHQDHGLKEVKRAAKLEAYVANFFAEEPVTVCQHLHYDCHTAIRDSKRERFAVYPYVPDRELPQQQKAFLDKADIQTVLVQSTEANTFSSFTSLKHNAQSFTLELGKVKPFGENDLSRFTGIDSILRSLIAGSSLPSSPERAVDLFVVQHSIQRSSEQWRFFVDDDVPNFTEFAPGSKISQDGVECYVVGDEPEYIVFPNRKVPVGQRAGLMLKRVSGQ